MIEIFDDIRKIYHFSPPCEELADYIEFFSESHFEATARHTEGERFTVKLFPSWTPTFWINLGAPYQLVTSRNRYTIKRQNDILVLRDTVATRHNLPSDYIFSVKFFPGGLEAIFGVNQPQFIDTIVDLKTILPAQLLQSLKRPMPFPQRMALLQNFFLLLHGKQKKKDHYLQLVRDSITLYTDHGMQYNTTEVAEKLFLSSKTINRYFHNIVGTSPKKYLSILRARTALTAYVAARGPHTIGKSTLQANDTLWSNGTITARATFSPCDFGYHDMSHFYKEVEKFTGTPLATRHQSHH